MLELRLAQIPADQSFRQTECALRGEQTHDAHAHAQQTKLALRKLAAAFPSALRELDSLSMESLQIRSETSRRVCCEGVTPPLWHRLLSGYHEVLRSERERRSASASGSKRRRRRSSAAILAELGESLGITAAIARAVAFDGPQPPVAEAERASATHNLNEQGRYQRASSG